MISKIQTDIIKLIKHFKTQGIWVFIGRFYLIVIAFLISLILTKNLSTEDYGKYKYIISLFSMFAFFSLPQSYQILIKYTPRNFNYLYTSLTKTRIKFSLLGSLSLILFYLYNIYYLNIYQIEFLIIAVLFPFYYAFDLFNPFLQAKMDFKFLNKLFILKSTCQILFIIIFLFFYNTVTSGIIAFLLSTSICNISIYYYVKKKYQIKYEDYGKRNILFKKQTIILSIIEILPLIVANFDKILIGNISDFKSLGIYSIGVLIGRTINGFFKPFLTTINAKLVHQKLNRRHYLLLFIFGSLIGVFISFFITPILIIYIYGENYTNSLIYANIIILSMGIYFLQTIYYNENIFHKKSNLKNIYINNIITPLILIILMALFIYIPNTTNFKLILLALLYPIRLFLIIITIYILNYRKCTYSF